ncbi:hypothetical protein, partial [Mesorhizobium sp. M4B.F.Ca.ET.013.02.1.1]
MRILKLAQSYASTGVGQEGHVRNPNIGLACGADVVTTGQPRSKTGQSEDGVSSERRPPTISVIICAYTADRWALLLKSVASAQEQT